MWTKIIFLSVLSFAIFSEAFNFETFKIKEVACRRRRSFVLEVVFEYFRDQHYITIIDLSDDHNLNGLRCSGGNVFYPIEVRSSLDNDHYGPFVGDSSVNSLPTSQGYLLKANSDLILTDFIPKLGRYNPKIKLMIRLLDKEIRDYEEAKEILKSIHDKYKMFDVAIVTQFGPGNNRSRKPESLCIYNPFCNEANTKNCIDFVSNEVELQLQKIQTISDSRVDNLQKSPLRIDIFEFAMVASPVYNSDKTIVDYSYVDGAILKIFAEKMNFTPVYNKDVVIDKYGTVKADGTFTGSLLKLELDQVDLVANHRLITKYNTTKAVYLQSVTSEKFYFVIKRRERSKVFNVSVYNLYDARTKVLSIIASVGMFLCFVITSAFEARIKNRKHSSLFKSVLHTIALYSNVSVQQPKFASTRLATLTIVFSAIISAALLQGTILKSLNLSEQVGAINTIQELIDRDYKLLMSQRMSQLMLQQSGDPLRDALRKSARKTPGVLLNAGLDAVITKKNHAYLWTDMYIGNHLNKYFDPQTGENLLEVVPEVAFEFYIAAMAPKTSPIIDKFNDITLQIIESGVNKYHLNQAVIDNDNIWYQRMKEGTVPKPKDKSLKMTEFFNVFRLYSVSSLVCIICFGLEFCFYLLIGFQRRLGK